VLWSLADLGRSGWMGWRERGARLKRNDGVPKVSSIDGGMGEELTVME
jgi:hypothetical protein